VGAGGDLEFDDAARKVTLDLGAATLAFADLEASPMPLAFSRAYAATTVMARLHQAHFRKATLRAYQSRCCVCLLKEHRLLDAAHIVPDRLPEGVAEVRNGMSMCPTHHRAYDRGVLLVHDDYRTEVRRDRLNAADAPITHRMLVDFSGREIFRPKDPACWPDPALLRRKLELVA
jgi:putative restriction endonuclease